MKEILVDAQGITPLVQRTTPSVYVLLTVSDYVDCVMKSRLGAKKMPFVAMLAKKMRILYDSKMKLVLFARR